MLHYMSIAEVTDVEGAKNAFESAEAEYGSKLKKALANLDRDAVFASSKKWVLSKYVVAPDEVILYEAIAIIAELKDRLVAYIRLDEHNPRLSPLYSSQSNPLSKAIVMNVLIAEEEERRAKIKAIIDVHKEAFYRNADSFLNSVSETTPPTESDIVATLANFVSEYYSTTLQAIENME